MENIMNSTMHSEAVTHLLEALPGFKFYFPRDPEYLGYNANYRSMSSKMAMPECIFVPRDQDEISRFVSNVSRFVLSGLITLAIVGCGQALRYNNAQNGITINLREIRGIYLNEQTRIVSIAAGEKWEGVYDFLLERGLVVAGGGTNTAGVVGEALHGTPSFFYSSHGFICDNIVNFEVVLASGEIVNANSRERADLWWALRGGGNNFGIVTRVDMSTRLHDSIYGGIVCYTPEQFPIQIQRLVHDMTVSSRKTRILLCARINGASTTICENQIFIDQPNLVQPPPELEPFMPRGHLYAHLGPKNIWQAAREWNALEILCRSTVGNKAIASINVTLPPNAALIEAAWNTFRSHATQAYSDPQALSNELSFGMMLQPYTQLMLNASIDNGWNSLGLTPQHGNLCSVRIVARAKIPVKTETLFNMLEGMVNGINAIAIQMGMPHIPYVDTYHTMLGTHLNDQSREALQNVSRQYDPDRFFQRVTGVFKLWD